MSHGADWLPLAANAGLSWVSAAVWGGGKWVFVGDRENRFLFFFWFVCLFWGEEERCSTKFKCRRRRHRFKVICWVLVHGSVRVWVCFAGPAEINSYGHFVLSVVSLLPLLCLLLRWSLLYFESCLNLQHLHSEMQMCSFCAFRFLAFMSPHRIGLTECYMIV